MELPSQWVDRLDFGALTKIPETEPVGLPEILTLMKLDQLDPKKNRAYRLATTSNTRQEQELQDDDDWIRKLIGDIPEIPDSDP